MVETFLAAGRFVDHEHPAIAALAQQLAAEDAESYARAAYEWVRDNIRHSWDFDDQAVSISASDALTSGTGLCYAKAHLLAALLRRRGIPTALCYQRLTEGDGHVVHGLVSVWLSGGWHRQDPRGNTNGTAAEFNLQREQLAWDVDADAGEVDYPQRYVEPAAEVVAALEAVEVLSQARLPDSLPAVAEAAPVRSVEGGGKTFAGRHCFNPRND